MAIPWNFDALLPAEQRYTSLKFRRAAPYVFAERLDYGEAAELCAFVHTIDGVNHAKYIFGWGPSTLPYVRRLMTHMDQFPDVANMVAENLAVTTRDDGLKCLRAMQDGGFRKGSVPKVVRLALLDMLDSGMSRKRVGDAVGLTVDQVQTMCHGGRRKPRSLGLAGLVAN